MPKIGATAQAKDGNFVFVVKSFSCGTTRSAVGKPLDPPAKGRFCAAEITVSSDGTQPEIFSPDLVEGFTDGLPTQYEADAAASVSANRDPKVFSRSVLPGKSIEVTVLFDVPIAEQIDIVALSSPTGSYAAQVDVKSANASRLP